MSPASLVSVALVLVVTLGSNALANPPPPETKFTANISCIDASRQNGQARIECQSCSAFYSNDGNTMADVSVEVNDTPGGDGSLIGCDTDTGGITGIISATSIVRASGPPGAVVPLRMTFAISITSTSGCSGSAQVKFGADSMVQNGAGSQSGTINGAGSSLVNEVSAGMTCSGCRFYDEAGVRHFFDCSNNGEAVADPSVSIDPNWPYRDLFEVQAFDSENQVWRTVAPPDLDQDNDGYEQPNDCNDFDDAINPGAIEVEDNEVDEDCSGGAAISGGAIDGLACVDDEDCESGACVTGLCCDTRCGDGDDADCQSCLGDDTGGSDGTCGALAQGTVCRASDGPCDLVEECDGMARTCNGDFREWAGQVCRASTGACDPAEACVIANLPAGLTTLCPADVQRDSIHHGEACTTGAAGHCGPGIIDCETCVATDVSPELCNGIDDDCNGVIDDGFATLGDACFAGVGQCEVGGGRVCSQDGSAVTCDAVPNAPLQEQCNGQDDDCDGAVDEGWDRGAACYAGQGACRSDEGTLQCDVFDGTAPAVCSAYPGAPQPETCNGIDDDCDDVVDNGVCAPIAVADSYTSAMDVTLVVPASSGLMVNDDPGPGAIVVLDSAPTLGVLALDVDGSFTYAPGPCTSGAVTFVYHLHDPIADIHGPSATVTVNVDTVAPSFAFGAQELSQTEGTSIEVTVRRRGSCTPAVQVTAYTQANTAAAGSDFVTQSKVLAFATGEVTQQLTVATLDDVIVEGTESFYIRLKSPTLGTTLGRERLAVATMNDDDDAGTFQLGALATEIGESAGQVVLQIVRTGATPGTSATVKWAPANGSAGSADYALSQGETKSVAFGPGETTKGITVLITPDGVVDGTESFRVGLTSPSAGSRLGDITTQVVHILDDDHGGAIGFAGLTTEVPEAAGSVDLQVVRNGATADTSATVRWSVAAGSAGATDYALAPGETGVVAFGPGETTKTITVAIAQDALNEGTESFRVGLSTASAGARLDDIRNAVVHIRDDDVPQAPATIELAALTTEVGESAGSVVLHLVRRGAIHTSASVKWATASGSAGAGDYALQAGETKVVSFAPGESDKLITLVITPDALVEGSESFRVGLTSPSAGSKLGDLRNAVVHIRDDDDAGVIAFAALTSEVAEAAGKVDIQIVRSGASAATGATVRWTLAAGSAGAADNALLPDETKVVVFLPGETTKTIAINITPDTLAEAAESFRLGLASTSAGARLGADRNAVVLIDDDDVLPLFAFAAAVERVTESAGSIVVRIVRSASQATSSVSVRVSASTATSPADFTAVGPLRVDFASDQTEATVTIPIVDDQLVEGDEALNVVLSSPIQGALAALQRVVVLLGDND